MRSERILLVDGESTSASSVTLLLATLGFPPADTAVTADEAVEIAENRLFDLVLFDEKNGERPQTANAAGRIIRHFGIPSIVLTADAELAARENSRLDAPFGYVRKPVRADELLEAIDRALFRRSVERRLDSKDRWLQAILAGAGDAIIATGVDEVIQFMNPAAGRLTGWPPDEARGIRIDRILRLHEADGNEETELLPLHGRATDSGALADGAMVLTKEQMPIHVDGTMSRIRDRDGNVEGTIFALHDTTLMQRLSDTIDYQANHDALTGLFNRAYFSRRLGALIEQAKAGNSTHALIYLDLDQFKVVNDTWGHLAGDELLRHATSIISTFIRSSDIGARIGSDEFGVLLERISAERARFIAERLKTAITNRKFLWEGKVFSLSSSIGVVTIDAKSNDAYGVLAAANDACYLARDLGGNRIQVYEDEQSLLQKRRGEMEWISKIKWALDEGAFRLYFQPIVPLLDSTLTPKCEILLRLADSEGKIVMPGDFLPAAERYNLVPAIDRWVISAAFDRYRRIMHGSDTRMKSYVYCINLSGTSLADGTLLDFIRAGLDSADLPPSQFCFEVTETAAIGNFGSATAFIRELKKIGCTFALDDFGSGFSSFSYLKNLPVDYLKIDGSFVKDMVRDPVNQAMVEAINNLGKLMNVQTVAEFVSDAETLELLKEIGVDYGQGYEIGRPQPFEE